MICANGQVEIRVGDSRDLLRAMPDQSVNCIVTSPPYFGLRDYGVDGQIGLEATPDAFVAEMVALFSEARRVLRDDGVCWVNLGDSYAASKSNNGGYSGKSTLAGFTSPDTKGRRANNAGQSVRINHGLKHKDLIGIPWRVAFALQADGWYLRQDIIWHKPNPMPESVKDRCTKAHEYMFMLTKSARYWYDAESIREQRTSDEDRPSLRGGAYINGSTYDNAAGGVSTDVGNVRKTDKQRGHGRRHAGFNDRWDAMSKDEQQALGRNKRSVWTVATQPYSEAHFATYPPALIEPCILAGCPKGGTVLDPFGGAGTTGLVAARHGRRAILCELNPTYAEMARDRIAREWAEPMKPKAAEPLGGLFALK